MEPRNYYLQIARAGVAAENHCFDRTASITNASGNNDEGDDRYERFEGHFVELEH